ncbi:MAG: twin-arginine translocase TatA/TatE family subunit [Bacillota bacterium]
MLSKVGWQELVIVLVIVLIIFGPGKLPGIGKSLGKAIHEFRKASHDKEEPENSEAGSAQGRP